MHGKSRQCLLLTFGKRSCILKAAASKGFEIFLDLKLHDIPNTVKKSIEGLSGLADKNDDRSCLSGGLRKCLQGSVEVGKRYHDTKIFGDNCSYLVLQMRILRPSIDAMHKSRFYQRLI